MLDKIWDLKLLLVNPSSKIVVAVEPTDAYNY